MAVKPTSDTKTAMPSNVNRTAKPRRAMPEPPARSSIAVRLLHEAHDEPVEPEPHGDDEHDHLHAEPERLQQVARDRALPHPLAVVHRNLDAFELRLVA